nr:aldo/keto reductase [Clostridia bacterium]
MKYREFGNTGEKISQLGFGCMRFPMTEVNGEQKVDREKTSAMLRRAYELGVNYFDTAVGYCNADSERALGEGIKDFRDKILLSTKCPMWDVKVKSDYRRLLEQSLERIGTDHIDFYHFHSLSRASFDEKVLGFNLLEDALKAKEEGLIKHISFSFHDKPEQMAYIIEKGEGLFESVLMQYNLLDRANEDAMRNAREKGLGTVIMGPVAGGRLAAPSALGDKLLGEKDKSTASLALRFVLGNKNVCCALSGMSSYEMVEENAAIGDMETPMTEADFVLAKERMESLKKFSDLYCTGCSYCVPCP